MSKSTESELSELHGLVARVLTKQLSEEITVTDETGATQVINTATPATLGVAIKFLKDNDITTSVEDDDNMSDLKELLDEKRKKRSVRLASVTEIG
jgi:transcriptional regulator with PAS, ATPase and Fis domain